MKFMNYLKNMNIHISQKHMYLIAIVVGAIALFSLLKGPREGFNNYIATGDMPDNDKDTDEYNNSYVAPAGNTVLYNDDNQHNEEQDHKHSKKCNHNNDKRKNDKRKNDKRKQNWSRNDGPLGIPRSQIPEGDEDLYILKTAVIPPVCPACPNVTACPNSNNKSPPPCPPCARCPEPAFDCKKVPNYNSNSNDFLPRPVLADFSQFGM